jgi:hypothetical protein
MDDYSVNSLTESKNEWCARLVGIFTPAVVQGLKSIFDEATRICSENDEEDKYLLTFQTYLSRVPKWNNSIVQEEKDRIASVSSCNYLEDLITCVHIIQLKALTCIRVGQEQKKVDMQVPSIDTFVHNVYTNVARKVYTNVYLFEKNIAPLLIQKNNRELELIIKECILQTIRETMPVEDILRTYLGTIEETDVDIKEEIIERPAPVPVEEQSTNSSGAHEDDDAASNDNNQVDAEEFVELKTDNIPSNVAFSDLDKQLDTHGVESTIEAPKTIDRLEKIAQEASERRKAEEAEYDDDDDDMPLKIGEEVKLELADVNDLNRSIVVAPPILEVETL